MKNGGYDSNLDDLKKLIITGKTPDTSVQMAPPENKKAENCIEGSKIREYAKIRRRNPGISAVISDPESEKIGKINSKHIPNRKQNRDHLPVFQFANREVINRHLSPPAPELCSGSFVSSITHSSGLKICPAVLTAEYHSYEEKRICCTLLLTCKYRVDLNSPALLLKAGTN